MFPLKTPSFPNKLKALPYVVIFFLLSVIAIDRCEGPVPVPPPQIIERIDTVWVERKDTLLSQPRQQSGRITPPKGGALPQPDTGYAELKRQYQELRDSFYTLKTYRDTLPIDSLGYVEVTDTVHQNALQGRKYSYHLKYPEVTRTITIREPYVPKRQLYAGGGLVTNFPDLRQTQVEAGILYKDRRDRILGVHIATDFSGNILYGVRSYWKIRLKN